MVTEREPEAATSTPPSRLASALSAAQFEVIPLREAFDRVGALPAGSCVTVTSSPTKGLEPTIELVERLAGAGYSAVPHLAARSVRDRSHLTEVVARLDAAGVRRAFVVAGDAEAPGPFPGGLSLLRALAEAGHPFADVGVPGYPDGHPAIAAADLQRALLEKQPFASYVITQLSFDPASIVAWIRGARAAGLRLPVVLGVPGPADLVRVARIASRIGVADSARYVRKNRGVIGAVLLRRAFRPDRLLAGLTSTVEDPAADVRGIHLFTFNQVEEAAQWRAQAVSRVGVS
jgi:methylenetetrahydrofolate reductase (NADPH)